MTRPNHTMSWHGVIPAITSSFDENFELDHAFMARHAIWLAEQGCSALVVSGSLGEAPTLSTEEKLSTIENLVRTLQGRIPLVAGIPSLATAEAERLARESVARGAQGLMVLPPYVYRGDWRETHAHLSKVLEATPAPCLLYNNPIAYGTDVLPEQIRELADEFPNLEAVKESSSDLRRFAAIRSWGSGRISLLVGIDDQVLDGISAGAVGWIAGLANAIPRESVELFNLAEKGEDDSAIELYHRLLPLLRMDSDPKFVQLIKFVQQEIGMGNARVRPPRLELSAEEARHVRATIRSVLDQAVTGRAPPDRRATRPRKSTRAA